MAIVKPLFKAHRMGPALSRWNATLEKEYHRGYAEGYRYGAQIAWSLAREEAAIDGVELAEEVPDEQGLRNEQEPGD